MKKENINNVNLKSANSCTHYSILCAFGVVSRGFFILNRCSDSSTIADYIEHKKSGSSKNFQKSIFNLVGAILKTGTPDLKVFDLDVKSLES